MALERVQPESSQCSRCGYSLAGLSEGARCPECGTPSGIRVSIRFVDNLSDAPQAYLKRLFAGLITMSLAMVSACVLLSYSGYYYFFKSGTLLSINNIEHYLAAGYLLCGLIWFAGTYAATTRRPVGKRTAPDPQLDSAKLRRLCWSSQACLPISIALFWTTTVGPTGVIGMAIFILAFLSMLLATLSLVPLAVYLSSVADWAGESALGFRMRGAAWIISVLGSAGVLLFAISLLPVALAGIFHLFALYALALNIFAIFNILFNVLLLAKTTRWAIINNASTAARNIRLANKLTQSSDPQHSIDHAEQDPNVCHECGVDLTNLGRSGQCPECHTVFVKQEDPWTPADLHRGLPLAAGTRPATDTFGPTRKISRIFHIPRAITKARVRYRPQGEISRSLPTEQSDSHTIHPPTEQKSPSIDKLIDDLPDDPPSPHTT